MVIQVLPTQLIPDDTEGKILRTRMIQKEGVDCFDPAFLFDEGSSISWVPCGRKLTCSFPGIKFAYGPDTYYDNEVSVIEMDGQFDNLQVPYRQRFGVVLAALSTVVVLYLVLRKGGRGRILCIAHGRRGIFFPTMVGSAV